MVKRLRIPKSRQKELSERFEQAVERLKVDDSAPLTDTASAGDGKKRNVAAAAR
jgi:hypothetical protein